MKKAIILLLLLGISPLSAMDQGPEEKKGSLKQSCSKISNIDKIEFSHLKELFSTPPTQLFEDKLDAFQMVIHSTLPKEVYNPLLAKIQQREEELFFAYNKDKDFSFLTRENHEDFILDLAHLPLDFTDDIKALLKSSDKGNPYAYAVVTAWVDAISSSKKEVFFKASDKFKALENLKVYQSVSCSYTSFAAFAKYNQATAAIERVFYKSYVIQSHKNLRKYLGFDF